MVGVGSSSDVAEVGRVSPELFDQVDGGHDEACAVADDSDVSIELYESKVLFSRLCLKRGDFRAYLTRTLLKLRLAKQTVIVHDYSQVGGQELSILRLNNRV